MFTVTWFGCQSPRIYDTYQQACSAAYLLGRADGFYGVRVVEFRSAATI